MAVEWREDVPFVGHRNESQSLLFKPVEQQVLREFAMYTSGCSLGTFLIFFFFLFTGKSGLDMYSIGQILLYEREITSPLMKATNNVKFITITRRENTFVKVEQNNSKYPFILEWLN